MAMQIHMISEAILMTRIMVKMEAERDEKVMIDPERNPGESLSPPNQHLSVFLDVF